MGERWPTHGGSSPAARPACNSGASLSSAAAKWASSTGPVFTQDGTQHFVRYRPGFAVAAGPRIEDQGWAARPRRVGKGLPAAQRGRQISQLRYVRHGRRGLGVVSGRHASDWTKSPGYCLWCLNTTSTPMTSKPASIRPSAAPPPPQNKSNALGFFIKSLFHIPHPSKRSSK